MSTRPFLCAMAAAVLSLGLGEPPDSTPIADYHLTDADALGQVQGPALLVNTAGARHAMERHGAPRYMNIPQDPAAGRALRFDGKSAYLLKEDVPRIASDFVLEAWCRAARSDHRGYHGVVSHGDGARGYSLVQRGAQWGALVGGVGYTAAGRVTRGQWIHLAVVVTGKGASLWMDGQRVAGLPRARAIAASFSIGDMGHGKEYFEGDISRVRLSGIGGDGFDPDTDLLIDRRLVRKQQEESRAATRARIRGALESIPLRESLDVPRHGGDWLVRPPGTTSCLQARWNDPSATLVLGNGLISRTFHLGQNVVCYSLRHEPERTEFLRSIKPEATLTIDGREIRVGGMELPGRSSGQKGAGSGGRTVANYFLTRWLDELLPYPDAFQLLRVRTAAPQAWLHWKPASKLHAAPWPPRGLRLTMDYIAPPTLPALAGLEVAVHYEIYDGLPVIGKWLSFRNRGATSVLLERTLIEELAFVDECANRVFVESEFATFHAIPTRWSVDPEFSTDSGPVFTERMTDYRLRFWSPTELDDAAFFRGATTGPEWQGEFRSRSLMRVQYPRGPARRLAPGESWETFRSWLLLQDSMDEERKGLARRKMYRTLFPWSQENLVYMHCLRDDSEAIRTAVDQCSECGFDMVILTFGSGFDMTSTDPAYIARVKADFDYAHRKGIRTGAYILFCSSRSYGDGEHDARPSAYGRSLCLGSSYADGYFDQLMAFMQAVGQDCIETDGPYHGYRCERTDHPLHAGVEDSWRVNWEQQCRFYERCMEEGIYIISPDWYFAAGNRKMPMGYKEANWTLPRAQQALVARQNIYDGTWWRTPAMSYHALPLTSVYGGGPESTMEPLSEHLEAYDRVLGAYFGMGIMACYRGYRLYDTSATKAVVKGWVDFYREHRAILDSDIIHVRRPDGRDLDCMMHANPALEEKGLAFIWNPTGERIVRDVALPLYYTGLVDTARVSEKGGAEKSYALDREYGIAVPVDLPPRGYTWLLIR